MSYVRVPPDSTGKKVLHSEFTVGLDQVHVQSIHVVDGLDPELQQRVDARGAARVSFADGQPTLDALGQLRVANATVLGAYDFVSGPQDFLFWDDVVGGGAVTHLPATSQMLLSVGTGATDRAARITNRYHYYQPGVGQFIIFSLALGDAGKANNVREWGYGDADNGVFFRLNGTSLEVVIRSDVTGSVVEEVILQNDWSEDLLDGTGVSEYTLDLTKRNIYWIDLLWLGSGTVRFGIFGAAGERITAHHVQNVNGPALPYMRGASLPVWHANYNTGVSGSTSEMRMICNAVYSEASADYVFWRYSDMENTALKTVTTDTPVLSVRSVLEVEGNTNRVGTYPETVCVYVTGGAIKLDLYVGMTDFTDATWGIAGASTLEGDEDATALTIIPGNGDKMVTAYLDPGCLTPSICEGTSKPTTSRSSWVRTESLREPSPSSARS